MQLKPAAPTCIVICAASMAIPCSRGLAAWQDPRSRSESLASSWCLAAWCRFWCIAACISTCFSCWSFSHSSGCTLTAGRRTEAPPSLLARPGILLHRNWSSSAVRNSSELLLELQASAAPLGFAVCMPSSTSRALGLSSLEVSLLGAGATLLDFRSPSLLRSSSLSSGHTTCARS